MLPLNWSATRMMQRAGWQMIRAEGSKIGKRCSWNNGYINSVLAGLWATMSHQESLSVLWHRFWICGAALEGCSPTFLHKNFHHLGITVSGTEIKHSIGLNYTRDCILFKLFQHHSKLLLRTQCVCFWVYFNIFHNKLCLLYVQTHADTALALLHYLQAILYGAIQAPCLNYLIYSHPSDYNLLSNTHSPDWDWQKKRLSALWLTNSRLQQIKGRTETGSGSELI